MNVDVGLLFDLFAEAITVLEPFCQSRGWTKFPFSLDQPVWSHYSDFASSLFRNCAPDHRGTPERPAFEKAAAAWGLPSSLR
jgi:hypothetical protein